MSEHEDREEFLREANVAILATVDSKGRPHAVPIWYLYEDGVLLMSTDRGSQKHRNIERNSEVTLCVDRRTLPYYAVMVHGKAEIGPRLSDEQRERKAIRYLGEELATAYLARVQGKDSVSLRLRPRKLIEFRGRAGRPESG